MLLTDAGHGKVLALPELKPMLSTVGFKLLHYPPPPSTALNDTVLQASRKYLHLFFDQFRVIGVIHTHLLALVFVYVSNF